MASTGNQDFFKANLMRIGKKSEGGTENTPTRKGDDGFLGNERLIYL